MACHGNPKPIACVTMNLAWEVFGNSHVPEDLLQALSMDQALIFVTGFVVDVGMDPLHAILN